MYGYILFKIRGDNDSSLDPWLADNADRRLLAIYYAHHKFYYY